MLPTLVAVRTRKRNVRAIFGVNLLLGWTLVGWVIALVWAFAFERAESVSGAEPPVAEGEPVADAEPAVDVAALPVWKPLPVQGQRVKLLVDAVARENPERSAGALVDIPSGTDVTVIHTRGAW